MELNYQTNWRTSWLAGITWMSWENHLPTQLCTFVVVWIAKESFVENLNSVTLRYIYPFLITANSCCFLVSLNLLIFFKSFTNNYIFFFLFLFTVVVPSMLVNIVNIRIHAWRDLVAVRMAVLVRFLIATADWEFHVFVLSVLRSHCVKLKSRMPVIHHRVSMVVPVISRL